MANYARKSGPVKTRKQMQHHDGETHLSRWTAPSVFFGLINLIVLAFLALNTYNRSEAAVGARVTRIESVLEYRVLPALNRIENSVAK